MRNLIILAAAGLIFFIGYVVGRRVRKNEVRLTMDNLQSAVVSLPAASAPSLSEEQIAWLRRRFPPRPSETVPSSSDPAGTSE